MEAPYSKISFDNLRYNEENISVGNVSFNFYHDQRCPNCDYCSPGWNDLRSEGPWEFTCSVCFHKWTVVMLASEKYKRRELLNTLKEIDAKIGKAKLIKRRYIKR
ncbi:MAG: hypothetical protein GY797_38980 [Deltaproteobacteria bacterium]|nr:hypothetical protein [Deltaproteobacteria bacterium]